MALKISQKRLCKHLAPLGFFQVGCNVRTGTLLFSRESEKSELWERIEVICQGKHGEAVYAYAWVSVVRGINATKGLVEGELLLELASVPERGWTIIESGAQARDWESRLTEVGPKKCQLIARLKGDSLLASTANARSASKAVFDWLVDTANVLDIEELLERTSTADQLKHARRLADWPGVLQIRDAEHVYRIATIALIRCATELSDLTVNVDADPLYDFNLRWVVQLLVDRILNDANFNESLLTKR